MVLVHRSSVAARAPCQVTAVAGGGDEEDEEKQEEERINDCLPQWPSLTSIARLGLMRGGV